MLSEKSDRSFEPMAQRALAVGIGCTLLTASFLLVEKSSIAGRRVAQ
jgi:hypothetical protein